jgi:hypothetical protein
VNNVLRFKKDNSDGSWKCLTLYKNRHHITIVTERFFENEENQNKVWVEHADITFEKEEIEDLSEYLLQCIKMMKGLPGELPE